MLCFLLSWEAWSCRSSCMGSVGASSCRCCMFVSCVHQFVNAGDHGRSVLVAIPARQQDQVT